MAIEQSQDYLHTGSVEFQSGVKITTGAAANKVLTSDASGNASWQVSGSGAILTATRTLTSAEILSLHTTPIEIIPAQGAGTFISVLYVLYSMTYNTTPYATDTTLRIVYNDNPIYTTIASNGILAYSQNQLTRLYAGNINTGGAISIINSAVMAYAPISNPTAGDSDVTVNVFYSVITL